jgi:type II secretory pathway component GspD/PulD (secretin)
MSRFRPARLAGVLFLALALAFSAAPGQQEGNKPVPSRLAPAEPVVRQVYVVHGGSAKELASTLTLHFKAEGNFLAVPEANSNTLLLSGPKAALEDALAVLRQIDRPARTVHVEIFLLELAAKAGGEGGGGIRPIDVAELSGPSKDVRAKVRELQVKGTITSAKTVELTTLAGQNATSLVSESKPYVTGVAGGFGGRGGAGPTSKMISYRDTGMTVRVKPEVGADGLVTLDLHAENSDMKTRDDGVTVGTDDKGAGISAPEFVHFSLESRVKVRPGQTVMAQGAKTGSKAGEAQTIVLVSASVDEAAPKSGK